MASTSSHCSSRISDSRPRAVSSLPTADQVKKRDDADAAEEEERAVSIVANLFAGLAKPARRDRVAAKFVEAEFEKCDRLVELLFRHRARVAAEERRCGRGPGLCCTEPGCGVLQGRQAGAAGALAAGRVGSGTAVQRGLVECV